MIIPPPGQERKIETGTNYARTVRRMIEVIHATAGEPVVVNLSRAAVLNGGGDIKRTVENFCITAFECAFFQPDTPDKQTIRTPRRLILDARANCVDYSVFIAAMAVAAKMPVYLCLASYPGSPHFTHVFPEVNGIIADVVPGQDQRGREYLTRTLNAPRVGYTVPFDKLKKYQV